MSNSKRFVRVTGVEQEEHIVLVFNEDGTINLKECSLEVYEGDDLVDADVPFLTPLEKEIEEEIKRKEDAYWNM